MKNRNNLKLSLKIRLATLKDKNRIYDALITYSEELKQFQENPTGEIASEKYFNYYWTESNRYAFAVFINDKLIGFCLLRAQKDCYNITEFYIKPKFRRIGCGKALLQFIIDFCKEQRVSSSMIANSLINNLGATNFWNANDFITLNEVTYEGEKYYQNLKKIQKNE